MASENSDSWGEFKSEADKERGYRVLSAGFIPGSVCDPDHDGDMDYGSSYEYDSKGGRVYKPDED